MHKEEMINGHQTQNTFFSSVSDAAKTLAILVNLESILFFSMSAKNLEDDYPSHVNVSVFFL